MLESRGGKEDMRLKQAYTRILSNGTDWIEAENIDETITSKELKIKPKAANISGLQIADLLAYPLYRCSLKIFNLKDDGIETFNERIIDVIKPKIYSRNNKIEGYGLKLLP